MAKTASGDLYLAPFPPRSLLSPRTHFHPSPPTDAQFPFRPLFNRCSWILILQGIIEKRIMRFDRSSIFLSRIRYLVQSVLLFSFFHGGARSYEINFIRLNFYEYSFQVQLLYTQEIKKKFLNVKKLKYPLSYKLLIFSFFFFNKVQSKIKK